MDYSELKKLAEACIAAGEYLPGQAWEEDRRYGPDEEAFLEFAPVATPTAILALIAENEGLRKDAERYRYLRARVLDINLLAEQVGETLSHGHDLWIDSRMELEALSEQLK